MSEAIADEDRSAAGKSAPNPVRGLAVLGLCTGLVANVLGFFPAGAGHGYAVPLFVSMLLPVIIPIALVRARQGGRDGLGWDVALVIYAVAADYWLIDGAIGFREYMGRLPNEFLVPGVHRSVFPMFVLWLIIWLFWQWLAMRTLVRHFLRRPTGSMPPP